jgi:uncharacterized protein
MRHLWIVAGLLLVGLAVVGAMLPLMPSTVFALGAAGCFARSSPRLEAWVVGHRHLGPSVRAWRAERAIPVGAKVLAVGSMSLSFVGVAATASTAVVIGVAVLLLGSALYVCSRPSPGRAGVR